MLEQFRKEYPLKFDLLIDNCMLVEAKAVESVHPIHKAQLLSYMNVARDTALTDHQLDGVSRLILPGANLE